MQFFGCAPPVVPGVAEKDVPKVRQGRLPFDALADRRKCPDLGRRVYHRRAAWRPSRPPAAGPAEGAPAAPATSRRGVGRVRVRRPVTAIAAVAAVAATARRAGRSTARCAMSICRCRASCHVANDTGYRRSLKILDPRRPAAPRRLNKHAGRLVFVVCDGNQRRSAAATKPSETSSVVAVSSPSVPRHARSTVDQLGRIRPCRVGRAGAPAVGRAAGVRSAAWHRTWNNGRLVAGGPSWFPEGSARLLLAAMGHCNAALLSATARGIRRRGDRAEKTTGKWWCQSFGLRRNRTHGGAHASRGSLTSFP